MLFLICLLFLIAMILGFVKLVSPRDVSSHEISSDDEQLAKTSGVPDCIKAEVMDCSFKYSPILKADNLLD